MSNPGESNASIYERISNLARTVHGAPGQASVTPQRVLEEVTEAAVNMLSGVDHAGVTLVRRSAQGRHPEHLESTAATGEPPRQFDKLQYNHGQGPCFEAIWTQQTVHIPDIAHEDRWPRLIAAVLDQTPIRATLSIQLYTDGEELGALNLHSNTPGGFDTDTEEMALNLAAHAAIAFSTARRSEQFRSGLASRDIIGQAKGLIMERYDVDAIRAFQMLAALSQEIERARRAISEATRPTRSPQHREHVNRRAHHPAPHRATRTNGAASPPANHPRSR